MKTTRRELLMLTGGTAAVLLLGTAVYAGSGSEEKEPLWRCSRCGKELRSHEDLSEKRCPRCFSKQLKKVQEPEG